MVATRSMAATCAANRLMSEEPMDGAISEDGAFCVAQPHLRVLERRHSQHTIRLNRSRTPDPLHD
jgi:hypothetical protein